MSNRPSCLVELLTPTLALVISGLLSATPCWVLYPNALTSAVPPLVVPTLTPALQECVPPVHAAFRAEPASVPVALSSSLTPE